MSSSVYVTAFESDGPFTARAHHPKIAAVDVDNGCLRLSLHMASPESIAALGESIAAAGRNLRTQWDVVAHEAAKLAEAKAAEMRVGQSPFTCPDCQQATIRKRERPGYVFCPNPACSKGWMADSEATPF